MLLLKSHPSVQIGNFKCQAFKAKSWMIVSRVSMSSTDHFHKVLRAMSAKITFMRKKKEMLQQTGWKYMFWKRWDKFYHFALTESPAALGGSKLFPFSDKTRKDFDCLCDTLYLSGRPRLLHFHNNIPPVCLKDLILFAI